MHWSEDSTCAVKYEVDIKQPAVPFWFCTHLLLDVVTDDHVLDFVQQLDQWNEFLP